MAMSESKKKQILSDAVNKGMVSLCADIAEGKVGLAEVAEIGSQFFSTYPLLLALEKRMLKEVNTSKPQDETIYAKYANHMEVQFTRKGLHELATKIYASENAILGMTDIHGEALPFIIYDSEGKPELSYTKGDGEKLFLAALKMRKEN